MDEVKSNKDYNPEMHSAEHILNQTMVRMFNKGRSFSNHIEKKNLNVIIILIVILLKKKLKQ